VVEGAKAILVDYPDLEADTEGVAGRQAPPRRAGISIMNDGVVYLAALELLAVCIRARPTGESPGA
jgi:hypothetical protein